MFSILNDELGYEQTSFQFSPTAQDNKAKYADKRQKHPAISGHGLRLIPEKSQLLIHLKTHPCKHNHAWICILIGVVYNRTDLN